MSGTGLRTFSYLLRQYSQPLLDQLLSVSGGVAVVMYILYTVDPNTVAKLVRLTCFFSSAFVIYCVFRFAMLVQARRISGAVDIITADRRFTLSLVLWAAYVVLMVRWGTSCSGRSEAGRCCWNDSGNRDSPYT